jgi:hypothetical protein
MRGPRPHEKRQNQLMRHESPEPLLVRADEARQIWLDGLGVRFMLDG